MSFLKRTKKRITVGVQRKQYLECEVKGIANDNQKLIHVNFDDRKQRIGKMLGKPIVLYQPTDIIVSSQRSDRYERVIAQGKVIKAHNGKATIALEAPLSPAVKMDDVKKMKVKIF